MDKEEIQKIILDGLVMANHARELNAQIPVSDTTLLYGSKGHLDSMALVAFLVDIEEALLDKDIQISLSDERAMSQARSPFRDVPSMVAYIDSIINDKRDG